LLSRMVIAANLDSCVLFAAKEDIDLVSCGFCAITQIVDDGVYFWRMEEPLVCNPYL